MLKKERSVNVRRESERTGKEGRRQEWRQGKQIEPRKKGRERETKVFI